MLDVTRLRVLDAVARHGSVTLAARDLDYSQSSVSHHLARLEAETGAQLLQRAGRGIRLTQAGQLLADRAAEIIGRIDAADAELSAHVGLTAGRVRLAGFASAIGSLVLPAAAELAREHPGLEIGSIDTHPPEALALLRTGRVEVAIVFRYDDAEDEAPGIRLHYLLDDPMYLLADRRTRGLASLSEATWVAGCPRCRGHLVALCQTAGFEPRIGYESDDMVLIQALVAAGLCVAGCRAWPCAPTTPTASSPPSSPACRAACTPRPTANRRTRRRSPRCCPPSPRRPPRPSSSSPDSPIGDESARGGRSLPA